MGLSALAFAGGWAISSSGRDRGDQFSPVVPASVSGNRVASFQLRETVTASAIRSPLSAGSPEELWQRLASVRRAPASERDMAEFLEGLATHDAKLAMALASTEANNRLCNSLKEAVLRGWASVSPDDAAAWALALTDGERQTAIEIVFFGAAKQPELAIKLGVRLCTDDPGSASDYGQFLIHGLTELGSYEEAARFAVEARFGNQDAWLNLAFSEWASHDPEQALAAYEKITDLQVRNAAFPGVIEGWVMANPASAAAYAARMAPGDDRTQVLGQALPQWASRDPLAASEWLGKNIEPGQDLNATVAAVTAMPNFVNQHPEMAVKWAEKITEPVLRTNTMRAIAQQWVQRDPIGLRRYLDANAKLAPIDRVALQEGASSPP